jgi:ABC-type polysaccharide/polyol phosphate transport system, ATPase component
MYRIYDSPQDRLKHMLLWRFGRHYGREFWALRNVSFEVRPRETVGIIGRNGSAEHTVADHRWHAGADRRARCR